MKKKGKLDCVLQITSVLHEVTESLFSILVLTGENWEWRGQRNTRIKLIEDLPNTSKSHTQNAPQCSVASRHTDLETLAKIILSYALKIKAAIIRSY